MIGMSPCISASFLNIGELTEFVPLGRIKSLLRKHHMEKDTIESTDEFEQENTLSAFYDNTDNLESLIVNIVDNTERPVSIKTVFTER